MKSNINVFIVDDGIPFSDVFVNNSVYDSFIPKLFLNQLVEEKEWKGHHNLKALTKKIITSKECLNGTIDVFGFTHPSICLDEIEIGIQPDIIIYDWEYQSEAASKSSEWLLELFNITEATVFVYSQVRDSIPPFLNKSVFDDFAGRFQLFLKGDSNNSVFSSEEFILQHILSRVTNSPELSIGGYKISFQENGFLATPSDILHIERILGKQNFLMKIKNLKSINNESIIDLFKDQDLTFYFDDKRNLLIDQSSTFYIDKFTPNTKLTALDVVKRFGIVNLSRVIESGITKI
jgi:hypothetical protein